jgi:hypothetical protein
VTGDKSVRMDGRFISTQRKRNEEKMKKETYLHGDKSVGMDEEKENIQALMSPV